MEDIGLDDDVLVFKELEVFADGLEADFSVVLLNPVSTLLETVLPAAFVGLLSLLLLLIPLAVLSPATELLLLGDFLTPELLSL